MRFTKQLLPCLVLLCSSAWGTIAFSQFGHNSATSGTVVVTVTINAGDTVMVLTDIDSAAGRSVSTVVDSASNAGYASRKTASAGGSTVQVSIWGSCNVASSATSVTVTVSGTYTDTAVVVFTYSGVGTNCFGNTGTNSAAATTTESINTTMQDANNFAVAAIAGHAASGVTYTANTGNLRDQQAAGSFDAIAGNDNTSASTGVLTNSVNNVTSLTNFAAASVELRSTNIGGGLNKRQKLEKLGI